MSLILVVLVIVGLGVAAIVMLRKPATSAAKPAARGAVPAPKDDRSKGRMLECGDNACAAAQALASTWFTESEAPKLPLPGCTQKESCRCRLVRVNERRTETRRVHPDRRGTVRFAEKPDRRSGKDRRKDGDSWRGHS